MRFPDDFIERCVETFDRDDLIKLLERGGPVADIQRIMKEESVRPIDSDGPPSRFDVEVAQTRLLLSARFDRMLNRLAN